MGVGGTDGYFSGDENMLPVFSSGSLASHLSILTITSRLYLSGGSLNVLCGLETSSGTCGSVLGVSCGGRSEEACLLCNDGEESGTFKVHHQYNSNSSYDPLTE